MLTIEQSELLNRMKLDLESVSCNKAFYKPSEVIWKQTCDDFEHNRFNNEGIGDVQLQSYNSAFASILNLNSTFVPGVKLSYDVAMWSLYNILKMRDVNKILDRTNVLISGGSREHIDPELVVGRPIHMDRRKLTWDYLFSMDTILRIVEQYPEVMYGDVDICELGAGWGRLAYYFTQVNPNIRYHIFDIPQVLIISHEYLKKSIRHTRVFSYNESRINEGESGIRFFTSNKLEDVNKKSFDLFINQASFQEMSYEQVSGYFERINFTSKRFYTFQRYNDLVMNYNKYPIYNNWVKKYDNDCIFDPLWFEQFYIIN